jgi:hypothetical protein
VGSQEYRRILIFFLLSFLVCRPIWLNYFLSDHHFGYITKSLKETLLETVSWDLLNRIDKSLLNQTGSVLIMIFYHFHKKKLNWFCLRPSKIQSHYTRLNNSCV